MQIIYENIKNLITIKTNPKEVYKLIHQEIRPELKLYDVTPQMQEVFITCLAEQCWFDMYGEHYNQA